MTHEIGWSFPPTGGGTYDGFNDPGIAHFDGAHEESLARETLQNSLDARAGNDKPVQVEFEVRELDAQSFRLKELAKAVAACLKEDGLDEKASLALAEAQKILSRPRLRCLLVADRNTTGLRGKQWSALVKARGVSVKDAPGVGGSHGIGKFAPLAVSPLRTVFYWTRFEDNGNPREFFQGKAVLMSHLDQGEMRQGTGYFGRVDSCQELIGEDVPKAIRLASQSTQSGTSIWIAGFRNQGEWQKSIARSVVTNFFGAIQDGHLSVLVEPSEEMIDRNLLGIEQGTIEKWFEYLHAGTSVHDDHSRQVSEARLYWELLRSEPTKDCQDSVLGHCELWIRVEDGLPNKVGLMRKNGMLITDRQRGLHIPRGLQDFVAICRFRGDDGNELLRQMENPQHTQFEPDRLPKDKQRNAKRALRRVWNWIRGELHEYAGQPPPSDPILLNDPNITRWLPDLEADESFGDDEGNEPEGRELQFGGVPTVRLRPRRRPDRFIGLIDEGVGDDGDDDGGANVPNDGRNGDGGGGDAGGKEGDGTGRYGRRQRIAIKDVRLVPLDSHSNRYRVGFTAPTDVVAEIEFLEAGDSTSSRRYDVRAYSVHGDQLSLESFRLARQRRVEFLIEADGSLRERAWIVSAIKKDDSNEI